MSIKILAVDTSTDSCSAALLIDNIVIERYKFAPRLHAQLILPMIQSLLTETTLALSNLDAIAFGHGPGSFTGVRIAASIIQGLAFGANLPVIPISSLRGLAQSAYRAFNAKKVLAAFDARMQEIYWSAYAINTNGLMQEVIPDCLCKPENIIIPENDNWFGAGDAWGTYNNILAGKLGTKLIKTEANLYPHAQDIARLALADFLAGNTVTASNALPKYLRSDIWQTKVI
jgi:tRNA threonylcarbamoyladenosine biosynthesis protein TsaB